MTNQDHTDHEQLKNVQTILEDNFMLFSVHIRRPPKTRGDISSARELARMKNADVGAATVSRSIWGTQMAQVHIKDLCSTLDRATAVKNKYTTKWGNKGEGLLANPDLFKIVPALNEVMADVAAKLKAIEPIYDRMVIDAKQSLGDMATGIDYPSFKAFSAATGVSFAYDAVPDARTAGNIKVVSHVAEKLAEISVRNHMKSVDVVVQRAWESIAPILERIAAQCDGELTAKGRAKPLGESMLSNAQELVESLKTLNLNSDPKLEETRQKMADMLEGHTIEKVRANPTAQKELHEEASDILSALDDMGW